MSRPLARRCRDLPGEQLDTSELRISTHVIRDEDRSPDRLIMGAIGFRSNCPGPCRPHTGELLFWSRRVRVASAVGAVAALVLLGGDVASTAATVLRAVPGGHRRAERCPPRQPAAPKPAALRISPRPEQRGRQSRRSRIRRRLLRNP